MFFAALKQYSCICLTLSILSITTCVGTEPWRIRETFLSEGKVPLDCHSSSIVETRDSHLCAVWKGGPGEGQCNITMTENVGIWASLFCGDHWSPPVEIVAAPNSVCWNPVLCKDPSGEIFLFYRVGPNPRKTVSFLKRSRDGGMSWSQEEILPAGIVGPTKNKPVVTAEGTLLCPSSFAVGEPEDRYKATACWIEISKDKGLHWEKVGPFEIPHRKFGVIEPALFFDQEGNLRMYARDRAHKIKEMGYIWEAISYDGGWHFSEFTPTTLPNPDSGFDIVDCGAGKLLLIYNHSPTHRFPLHFATSLDGGNHWSQPVILDDRGEFPAAVLAADGLIHITYAVSSLHSEQRRIKYVIIDPSSIFGGAK